MTDSIYGILKYTTDGQNGGGKYGQQPKLTFSASPFDAIALQGNRVQLVWNNPAGSDSQTFTAIRLIRNYDQYPEHAEDGEIILQSYGTKNPILDGNFRSYYNGVLLNGHIDSGVSGGKYAYYAIWVRMDANYADAPLEWFRVGTLHVLVPIAHDTKTRKYTVEATVVTDPITGESAIVDKKVPVQTLLTTNDKFVQSLPEVFTRDLNYKSNTESTLRNFLTPFSFTLDETLTYADLTIPDVSGRKTAPSILGLQAFQFGLPQDAQGVTSAQKRLVRDALHIYSRKGTSAGLTEFLKDVSGYEPTITISPNIMLSIQDSSFYKGKGFWTESPAVPATGTAPITLTAKKSPVGVISSIDTHDVVFDTEWVGEVVVTTAGSKLILGLDNPITRGIPISKTGNYIMNMAVYSTDADKTGSMRMVPLDASGNTIERDPGRTETFSFTQNAWKRVMNGWNNNLDAVWLGLEIIFDQPGTYYLDKFCIYTPKNYPNGANMTDALYVEPRMLDIFLNPSQVNYITNPSFESNTTGWTGSGVTLSKFDTTDGSGTVTHAGPSEVVGNRYLLRGIAGGSGGTITPTPLTSTTAGDTFYSWSFYTEGLAIGDTMPTAALTATVQVPWQKISRSNNVLTIDFGTRHPFVIVDAITITSATSSLNNITRVLQASDLQGIGVISFANSGSDEAPATVDGAVSASKSAITPNTFSAIGWVRTSASLYVPATWGGYSVTVAPTILVEADSTNYFEAAQLEEGIKPKDYFDGNLGAYTGCAWIGSANASYSAKYISRRRRLLRVQNEIQSYLPINTVYQIRDYVSTQLPKLSL